MNLYDNNLNIISIFPRCTTIKIWQLVITVYDKSCRHYDPTKLESKVKVKCKDENKIEKLYISE